MSDDRRLIEDYLPIEAISAGSVVVARSAGVAAYASDSAAPLQKRIK